MRCCGSASELHAAIATFLDSTTHCPPREKIQNCSRIIGSAQRMRKGASITRSKRPSARAPSMLGPKPSTIIGKRSTCSSGCLNSDRNRIHARVLQSSMWLPGFVRDDTAERGCCSISTALENAMNDGDPTAAINLQVGKGAILDDETLLVRACAEAEALGDVPALASAEQRYGHYLGIHGQFENSLAHVARSIELMGARGQVSEGVIIWMSAGGRCYSARAGRLDGFAMQSGCRRGPTRLIVRGCGPG